MDIPLPFDSQITAAFYAVFAKYRSMHQSVVCAASDIYYPSTLFAATSLGQRKGATSTGLVQHPIVTCSSFDRPGSGDKLRH